MIAIGRLLLLCWSQSNAIRRVDAQKSGKHSSLWSVAIVSIARALILRNSHRKSDAGSGAVAVGMMIVDLSQEARHTCELGCEP